MVTEMHVGAVVLRVEHTYHPTLWSLWVLGRMDQVHRHRVAMRPQVDQGSQDQAQRLAEPLAHRSNLSILHGALYQVDHL